MKKSYQLLSIDLDGIDIMNRMLTFADNVDLSKVEDISVEENLFDYLGCIRKISGRDLLSMKSVDYAVWYIDRFMNPLCLIVVWDYQSRSNAANQLYTRRILQMIECLRRRIDQMNVKICSDIQN